MLQLDYSRSVDSPEVSLLLQGHSPCRVERHPSAHGGTGGAGGAGRPPPPPAMAVLAAHPTEALAASAGSDRTLRLWGLRQKQMVAMRALPAPAAALAFSAGGELAAALHGGGVLLLEARRLSELPVDLMAGLPAGAWRTSRALGFSPDGAVLAVGTDAGSIELFVTGGGWERLGSCQAHRAPVASLDWADFCDIFIICSASWADGSVRSSPHQVPLHPRVDTYGCAVMNRQVLLPNLFACRQSFELFYRSESTMD